MIAGPLVAALGLRGAFSVLAGVMVVMAPLAFGMRSSRLFDKPPTPPR